MIYIGTRTCCCFYVGVAMLRCVLKRRRKLNLLPVWYVLFYVFIILQNFTFLYLFLHTVFSFFPFLKSSLQYVTVLIIICSVFNILQEGLLSVGIVTDEELSKTISQSQTDSTIILWQAKPVSAIHTIQGSDSKEILNNVLGYLPNPDQLSDSDFRVTISKDALKVMFHIKFFLFHQEIRNKLRDGHEKPWLLCFFVGAATELDLQLKRLPIFLPHINIGEWTVQLSCQILLGLDNNQRIVYHQFNILLKIL